MQSRDFSSTPLPEPDFRAMGDRVLVLPDEPSKVLPSGIVIPDSVRRGERELHFGRVVTLGPGFERANGARMPMPDIRRGDRVVYYPYGTQTIEVDGMKYVSMRDDNVHGVVEPD